jgi:molybdopterin synthase catalytic subunit
VKIRVLAFATAADALGSREFEVELEDGASVAELLAQLEADAPELGPIWNRLAIAVNGELAGPERTLTDAAEVALLPPVSGGDAANHVQLVSRRIEASEVAIVDPSCGAEVLFLGRVRDHSRGYEAMAEAKLRAICRDLSRHGALLRIIHRLGDVPVGEVSVAIAARAPHRREAFTACAEALERLKRETPIWKLEHYDDGSFAWREEEPLSNPAGNSASTA